MEHCTPLLDPAVMPRPDNFSIDHQYRADGNPPFGQSLPSFLYGCLHELFSCIGIHSMRMSSDHRYYQFPLVEYVFTFLY